MTEAEEPLRPEPEALLAEAGRAGRGRLKIYLGMAPGVGKTYAMLEGARQAKAVGRDVVVGVVVGTTQYPSSAPRASAMLWVARTPWVRVNR